MDKVEAGYSLEQHVEGESRHLGAPLLRLELAKELEELQQGEPWRVGGHNAKTLVKYPDLRVVLIALKAGSSLKEHHTKGRLSIHTLEGHVHLKLGKQVVDLPKGCLLGLGPSIPHDVEAVEQSAVLLTITWPTTHEDNPKHLGDGEDASLAPRLIDILYLDRPCPRCGETYQLPLVNVSVSQQMIHEGCPLSTPEECPPLVWSNIFGEAELEALETAWLRLKEQARSAGGRLRVRAS